MGLFDFLKDKPEPNNPPANKPAQQPADQPADPSAKGPRYQGAKYTAPAPDPAQAPPMPAAPTPPMPFQPENILEQLLLLAATEEQARPAFYQALLQEPVLLILAPVEGRAPGEVAIQENQEIQLQVLSDGKLPIFTSPARLSDGGQDGSAASYAQVPGHAFFGMVQGQDCVLNPFSPAGKLLPKEEIAALLAGQLTGPAGPPTEGEQQVMLSQPAEFPQVLADGIREWCAGQSHIQAAYLAQMAMASQPDVQRLLLAFETTSQDPAFMQQLGPVLEGKTGNFQFVDLMILDKASDEGVNPYFRQIMPFYTK